MSGYVGYLGKYRHSSDGRHAADIRRASAEHQGLEYVESDYNASSELINQAYQKTPDKTQSNTMTSVKKSRKYTKPVINSSLQARSHDLDYGYVDQQMPSSAPNKSTAADCKIVYKKTRKISMKNFNS